MKRKSDLKFAYGRLKQNGLWINFFIKIILNFLIVYLAFQHTNLTALVVDAGLNFQPGREIQSNFYYDFLLSGSFGARGSLNIVIAIAVFYAINLAILNIIKYLNSNLGSYSSGKIKQYMRIDAYKQMCVTNKKFNNGELLTLLNDDVVGIGSLNFVHIPGLLMDVFYILMAITTLFTINAYLLIVPLIAAPLILIVAIKYIKALYKVQLKLRKQNAKLKLVAQDNIEGIKELKLFNNLEYSVKKFSVTNKKQLDLTVKKGLTGANYILVFNTIQRSAYVISLLVGGILAINNLISIGQFLVFTGFVATLLTYTVNLVTNYSYAKLTILQNRKMERFLSGSADLKEVKNATELNVINNYNIDFNDVKLKVDNKFVLNGITVFVPRGSTLGVVGGIEDGADSFIKVLTRGLNIESGSIRINDTDIQKLKVSNLRDLVSLHLEQTFLFNNTIKNNLLLGGAQVSDEQIYKTLDAVFATEVLEQTKGKLQHHITENGNEFGTYKGRLSIARAILKQSPIYVFEDFALGYSDDEKKVLCKNIESLLPSKTIIFTSDDFNDVKTCDYILVLDKGKVKYYGNASTYKKLLSEGGVYE